MSKPMARPQAYPKKKTDKYEDIGIIEHAAGLGTLAGALVVANPGRQPYLTMVFLHSKVRVCQRCLTTNIEQCPKRPRN